MMAVHFLSMTITFTSAIMAGYALAILLLCAAFYLTVIAQNDYLVLKWATLVIFMVRYH